jgi:hypothetical protein
MGCVTFQSLCILDTHSFSRWILLVKNKFKCVAGKEMTEIKTTESFRSGPIRYYALSNFWAQAYTENQYLHSSQFCEYCSKYAGAFITLLFKIFVH